MGIRLAVLVSGGGTTLKNLIDRIGAGQLDAQIVGVIGSRADAFGLERARRAGIADHFVPVSGRPTEQYSQEMFALVRDSGAELVVLAGFLHLLRIPDDYFGKVLNIHPSLIPAFCGHGFYGQRVHRAVLDRGVKISGCTVHFADNQYDHGPIILQRAVDVAEDDTPESLAQRVFVAECEALPEAIALFAAGRLRIDGPCVRISPR